MMVRDAQQSDLGAIAELLLVVQQMHVMAQPETYRDISHEEALQFLATRLTQSNAYLRVACLQQLAELFSSKAKSP